MRRFSAIRTLVEVLNKKLSWNVDSKKMRVAPTSILGYFRYIQADHFLSSNQIFWDFQSEAIKQKYLMFFLARGMIWLRETKEGPVFFFKWIGIKTTTPMISWQSQNEIMTNVFDGKLNLEGASKWLVTGEIKKRCALFSGNMTHPKWAASLFKKMQMKLLCNDEFLIEPQIWWGFPTQNKQSSRIGSHCT